MGNFSENILKKSREALAREIPREEAKKIAKTATAIVVIIMLLICLMIITAPSRVLGEWKTRLAYNDEYIEPGYYYVEFDTDGDCAVSFDIEDSILGWTHFGTWIVSGYDLSGINISVSTYSDPKPAIYHYNPFTNKVTTDSLRFKKVK